jgi:hypothetical protein
MTTRNDVRDFLRRQRPRVCVQASISSAGAPQAAVVAFVVTDDLEIVFQTVVGSRKMQNLRRDPRIAFVVSDEDEMVQIEGIADEPTGEELERLKAFYCKVHPEAQSWQATRPGDDAKERTFAYVRVKPTWVRHSDFRKGGGVAEVIRRSIDPVVLRDLCDDLAPVVDRELAAGNSIVETYRGYPAVGVNVWFGLPFRAEHTDLPPHVVFNNVNDPHYWLAEYACTKHDHVLACPFPRTPDGHMTWPDTPLK